MSPKQLAEYQHLKVLPMSKMNLKQDYPLLPQPTVNKTVISINDPSAKGTAEDNEFQQYLRDTYHQVYTIYALDYVGDETQLVEDNKWNLMHDQPLIQLPEPQLLTFMNWNTSEEFLVHCRDGESRSTAVALYLAYLKHDPELFDQLLALPKVTPNLLWLCYFMGTKRSGQPYYQIIRSMMETI